MPRNAFVFSADWHLAKRAWTNYPTLCDDAYYALEQLVDYCCECGLPLVGGGDLFDTTKPDSESVAKMCACMQAMKDQQQPVYVIQGQHEAAGLNPWLCVHDHPQHVHEQRFEPIAGIPFWGIDYTPRGKLPEVLARIPADTVGLVMHQVWADFMPFNAELSFSDVPFATLLLTGDYHVTISNRRAMNKNGGDMVVYSPGSICMQEINESPDKYFYVMSTTDGKEWGAEAIRLNTRRCYRAILDTADKVAGFGRQVAKWLEEAYDTTLDERIRKPILHVKFDPEIPEAYQRIREAIGDRAFLFDYPLVKKTAVAAERAPTALDDDSLVGNLPAVLEPGSPLFNDAARLLEANTPSAALADIYDECLKGPRATQKAIAS